MYPPFFESPGEPPGRSCHSLWATARLSTSLALQTAPPQEESGGETVRRGAAAPHLGPRRDLRHTLTPTPPVLHNHRWGCWRCWGCWGCWGCWECWECRQGEYVNAYQGARDERTRDRRRRKEPDRAAKRCTARNPAGHPIRSCAGRPLGPVSYTHLTLPTIYSV